MEERCETCRWWHTETGDHHQRYLSNPPDGWKLCLKTAANAYRWGKPPEGTKAYGLETDGSLAVMATAPDFYCCQYEPRGVGGAGALTGKQLFECLKESEFAATSSYDDQVKPYGRRWTAILDGTYDLDLAADLIVKLLQEPESSPPHQDHPAAPAARP